MPTQYSKLFIIAILTVCTPFTTAQAEIIETTSIEQILPYVEQDTLVLFNIAEVLTDSSISLGSSPSRKYIKANAQKWAKKPACDLHDALTWLIANKIPHKAVETATPKLISDLQDRGVAVAALTSRGRSEWYTTDIHGVDDVTEAMLDSIGIDLTRSPPPIVSIQMEGSPYLDHYRNGIYYANHMEKGEFLKHLLQDSGYQPKTIILVDDKLDSLESVDAAMKELGIPFTGFWYTRTKQDRANFDPLIAIIQLQGLTSGCILSDEQAQAIIVRDYDGIDKDMLFFDVLGQIDFSEFPPPHHE